MKISLFIKKCAIIHCSVAVMLRWIGFIVYTSLSALTSETNKIQKQLLKSPFANKLVPLCLVEA